MPTKIFQIMHDMFLEAIVTFMSYFCIRDHSFSAYAKVSGKLTFLTPWYAHMCVSGGKRCSFFGKFCIRATWMTPKILWHAGKGKKYSRYLLLLQQLQTLSVSNIKHAPQNGCYRLSGHAVRTTTSEVIYMELQSS